MTQVESKAVQRMQPDSRLHFRQQVRRAVAHIAALQARKQRGPTAKLRKLRPTQDQVPPQVFWEVVEECEIRSCDEDLWLTMLPLMVRHPHTPGVKLGDALASAQVSAARVERWLRLDRAAAWRETRRLLSRLGDGGFNWTRFAPLLRDWAHPEYGKLRRRAFAREFFLSDTHLAPRSRGDDA